jgi:hypothetical protein
VKNEKVFATERKLPTGSISEKVPPLGPYQRSAGARKAVKHRG